MHACEFAFAVSRHLGRLIGSDRTQALVREHSSELNRTVGSSVLRFSLLRIVFSVDPAEDDLPRLLSLTLSSSARLVAQLFVKLAWIRGGRTEVDGRIAVGIRDVEHIFRMFIDGLRTSEPFAIRHAATRPSVIAPIHVVDDELHDVFASPRRSRPN